MAKRDREMRSRSKIEIEMIVNRTFGGEISEICACCAWGDYCDKKALKNFEKKIKKLKSSGFEPWTFDSEARALTTRPLGLPCKGEGNWQTK